MRSRIFGENTACFNCGVVIRRLYSPIAESCSRNYTKFLILYAKELRATEALCLFRRDFNPRARLPPKIGGTGGGLDRCSPTSPPKPWPTGGAAAAEECLLPALSFRLLRASASRRLPLLSVPLVMRLRAGRPAMPRPTLLSLSAARYSAAEAALESVPRASSGSESRGARESSGASRPSSFPEPAAERSEFGVGEVGESSGASRARSLCGRCRWSSSTR